MCEPGSNVTTYAALRASGLSRADIHRMRDAGQYIWLRRGVYAPASACGDAQTAAQHGGAMGCVTAARHLGLWVLSPASEVHVWLRGHGHSYPHDGCDCVEHWDDAAARDVFGVPSVPRLLRQILACRGVEEFFVSLESALHLRLISLAGVRWLHETTFPAAREAIALAHAESESGLESLLRWRLRHLGTQIGVQVRIVSVGRVDFLIGDCLIVEVDGAPFHDGETNRHRDLMRDANAAAWGYHRLRFDYAMVVHDWETVELAIMAYVDRGWHLAAHR